MGKRIHGLFGCPDIIISSGAKRAFHTAELFAKDVYCKSLTNLMKDWPNPLPSGTKKEVLKAYDFIKADLEKENC